MNRMYIIAAINKPRLENIMANCHGKEPTFTFGIPIIETNPAIINMAINATIVAYNRFLLNTTSSFTLLPFSYIPIIEPIGDGSSPPDIREAIQNIIAMFIMNKGSPIFLRNGITWGGR